MLDWPFQKSTTLAVQGWGFWFGVLGLLITVVGFGLTLFQLVRTRQATERVAIELGRVQGAMKSHDSIHEAASAMSALSHARRRLQSDEWGEVAEAFASFRSSLHIIREQEIPELERFEAQFDTALKHAKRICERIEGSSSSSIDIDRVKTFSAIRDHEQLLNSIVIAIESRSFQ